MHESIRQAIQTALEEIGITEADFVVEHPAEIAYGDYACNVAMVLAKQVGQAPRQLAEQIAVALAGKIPGVEKIEIAGPGFLNFYLERTWFSEQVAQINTAGEDWGKNNSWQDKVVIVEYTDPNPFKELHIGHLVPNALGESLARLFMFAGADTKRVTFQGDVGMHVAKAIYGLQAMKASVETGFDAATLGKAYAAGSAAFETEESTAVKIKALNKTIYERSDDAVNALYDYGKKVSLGYFEEVYDVLGSKFEYNFFESVTAHFGYVAVNAHLGDVFTKSEGAIIFEGEKYGLHNRVFINSEDIPTYEAKDIGLLFAKTGWVTETSGKPFDLNITVTGTEQQSYFQVVMKAASMMEPEVAQEAKRTELVPNGMLRLSEGKMSSRTGNVVRALDLINDVSAAVAARSQDAVSIENKTLASEIAVAAIKYSILKIAAGKDIVFDLKQALSFEGDSGPYLQYTYARIRSVLQKAAGAGVLADASLPPPQPYHLEKILYRFEEVIQEALVERAPHKVVTFLTELAGAFNTFYAQEKIADPDDQYAPYKAALAQAVGQTLENGLWVLGIKAPKKI